MMARGNRHNRFTIYDMMEAAGKFSENPANADSVDPTEGGSLYKGPVPYPKMFYHPQGETRVIVPGEAIVDPLRGPMLVGQQSEIIHEIVSGPEEEKKLRDAGWHDHPAKAIAAGGGEAPATSSAEQISDLEARLAAMQAELDRARSSGPSGSGAKQKSGSPEL